MIDKSNLDVVKKAEEQVMRFKSALIKQGVPFVDNLMPPVEAMHAAAMSGTNKLYKVYFSDRIKNIDDLYSIYDKKATISDDMVNSEHPEAIDFIRNFVAKLSNMNAENAISITKPWGEEYDPVSKMVILMRIGMEADNAAFNSQNETLDWLKHNLGYYSKIGYMSQYNPEILEVALKSYERTEACNFSDVELDAIVHGFKQISDLMKPYHGTLKRLSIDKTSEEATSKNNMAAEGDPGYGNQKHPEVLERVIKNAKYMNEHADETDATIYIIQHRIQPDGNVLLQYAGIELDEATGLINFNDNMLIDGVRKCAAERGHIITYLPNECKVLPEISNLVSCKRITNAERGAMVPDDELNISSDRLFTNKAVRNLFATFSLDAIVNVLNKLMPTVMSNRTAIYNTGVLLSFINRASRSIYKKCWAALLSSFRKYGLSKIFSSTSPFNYSKDIHIDAVIRDIIDGINRDEANPLEFINKKRNGEYIYNYVVTLPNVFKYMEDRYPNAPVESQKKIAVKTRGVFAAASYESRLQQTFLYPWIDLYKKILVKDDYNNSLAVQWWHPDAINQMFTDMAFITHPHMYDNYPKLTTRIDKAKAIKQYDDLINLGFSFIDSSDDKTGFDNIIQLIYPFGFVSVVLAPCFNLTEDDKRILRHMMTGIVFPVCVTPSGPEVLSMIVPSGMGFTSAEGTTASNVASYVVRYALIGALDVDGVNPYIMKADDSIDEESNDHNIEINTKQDPISRDNDSSNSDDVSEDDFDINDGSDVNE